MLSYHQASNQATNNHLRDFSIQQSSNIFPNASEADQMSEIEYRQWLDRKFNQIFSPYESDGGIPCKELLNRFQYNNFGLPQDRFNNLMLHLDGNRSGRINFKEFRSIVVHVRYIDLPIYKRIGLRALLSANPGMRLQAAKIRAAEHLRFADAAGRSGLSIDRLPDLARGGFPSLSNRGGFCLEPDGVWPTSLQPASVSNKADAYAPTKTIMQEIYVPRSYLKAYSCKIPPMFLPIIAFSQLATFIYYAVKLNTMSGSDPSNLVSWISGFPYSSPLFFDPRRRREAWRYISYIFLHQGILHILFNSLITVILGTLMEWVHKFWRVVPLYFAGVLAGSLSSSVLDPYAVLIGSSGGVYALLGAHLSLSVISFEELQHDLNACKSGVLGFTLSGVFRFCVVLLVVGVDFGLALYRRYGLNAPLTVSFCAHCAGFLVGLLLGIPLLRISEEKPWRKLSFWMSILIYIAFLAFSIFWNIFWPNYPEQLI